MHNSAEVLFLYVSRCCLYFIYMCKYKNQSFACNLLFDCIFYFFSTSLYSKRQISIVLSHVFYFLSCCCSLKLPSSLLLYIWERVLADLEAICALYPPISQSLEYIYTRLLFFKLLCTEDFPRWKEHKTPDNILHAASMKSVFYVAIMHSHSYKMYYFNLIPYLTTYLVLGVCSVPWSEKNQ